MRRIYVIDEMNVTREGFLRLCVVWLWHSRHSMLWLLLPSHLIRRRHHPRRLLVLSSFPPPHSSSCSPVSLSSSLTHVVVLRRRLREGRLDESAQRRKGLCSFRASVASVVFRVIVPSSSRLSFSATANGWISERSRDEIEMRMRCQEAK